MPLSNLVRAGGGLTSAAAGILLALGHIFNLGGNPAYGTVLGTSLVFIAHVILVFALVAIYSAQSERSGPLGSWGMVLSVLGTTLASAVVFVEIAGASGVDVEPVLGTGAPAIIDLLGSLGFFIGLILFGVAVMRAGVFARWAGLLLIVGDIVFAVGSFAGSAAPVVFVIGGVITGAGFAWLGLSLLSGQRRSLPARQSARVS